MKSRTGLSDVTVSPDELTPEVTPSPRSIISSLHSESQHTAVDNNDYDLVISGMGPVGLLAAWQAINREEKVFIISDRNDEFTRMPRMVLHEKQRQCLLAIADKQSAKLTMLDLTFIKELKTRVPVAVKDSERFLMRQICSSDKLKNITIQLFSELKSIDLKQGIAEFGSSKKSMKAEGNQCIYFKNMICADGDAHHAVDLANENQAAEKRIIYSRIMTDWLHRTHVSAYVKIARKDGRELTLLEKNFIPFDEEKYFSQLIINKDSHLKAQKKSVKCNLTGELPEEIFAIKNDELRKKLAFDFIKEKIKRLFKNADLGNGALDIHIVKTSKKYGLAKDKMKLSIFETQMQQASHAVLTEGEYSLFVMGNAFNGANYQMGHGFNDGLSEAIFFDEVAKKIQTPKAYDQYCKKLGLEANKNTRMFYLSRMQNHKETFPHAALNVLRQRLETRILAALQEKDDILISLLKEAREIKDFLQESKIPNTFSLDVSLLSEACKLSVNPHHISYIGRIVKNDGSTLFQFIQQINDQYKAEKNDLIITALTEFSGRCVLGLTDVTENIQENFFSMSSDLLAIAFNEDRRLPWQQVLKLLADVNSVLHPEHIVLLKNMLSDAQFILKDSQRNSLEFSDRKLCLSAIISSADADVASRAQNLLKIDEVVANLFFNVMYQFNAPKLQPYIKGVKESVNAAYREISLESAENKIQKIVETMIESLMKLANLAEVSHQSGTLLGFKGERSKFASAILNNKEYGVLKNSSQSTQNISSKSR